VKRLQLLHKRTLTLIAVLLSTFYISSLQATEEDEFFQMGLEDLMQVEITSASKHAENISDVPSSIFVLDNETIRLSGAKSIPDLLRLVPGTQVAQIDRNKWAISIRGMNGKLANKLLVLKDGRSIYSPVFSGVYWDTSDFFLGDIERIEVIRGPGGSVWGSNAVNGIINIISKSAKDSQTDHARALIDSNRQLIAELNKSKNQLPV
jgi:iron complex outermembrane receptor protein